MSDAVRDLLVRGIAAAKAGEKAEARRKLEWVLDLDPDARQQVQAWLWLSEVCDLPAEKRHYLELVLSADPGYAPARRGLAILDGKLRPEDIVDPNRLPAKQVAAGSDARRFSCPTCGGRMSYTPDGSSLTCEYCEARHRPVKPVPVQAAPQGPLFATTQDFAVAMASFKGHVRPELDRMLECPACGAAIQLDADDLSGKCPYCATAYVVEDTGGEDIFPVVALAPLTLSRNEALQALHAWMANAAIRGRVQIKETRGIYLPAWLFSISAPAWGSAAGSWNSHAVPASGTLYVTIPASRSLPEKWQTAFRAFDPRNLVPFDPAYLANWQAETYTVPFADASLAARYEALERLPGAASAGVKSMDLTIDSFQLILLPFWRVSYWHADQEYEVLVDGRSGQIWA